MILDVLYSVVRSLLDLLVLSRNTDAPLQVEVLADLAVLPSQP